MAVSDKDSQQSTVHSRQKKSLLWSMDCGLWTFKNEVI